MKKKEVLHNIELLDKKMKKGKIDSTKYFTEFDNQKLILKQIKQKIQELEEIKKQKHEKIKPIEVDITPEDQILNLGDTEEFKLNYGKMLEAETEAEIKQPSLKDKIKKYLPNLPDLKLKIGTAFSETEPEMKKENLRNFKFFNECSLKLDEHPNFIHLAIRDYLEDLGYKVLKIKKPLPEMVEIEQGKSRIIENSGFLVGVKIINSKNTEDSLSIFVKQEGICTIFFDGQGVITQMKVKISLAGKSQSINDDVLESDIKKLSEKINLLNN